MNCQHTRANLILLLKKYNGRKSKTDEVPGMEP